MGFIYITVSWFLWSGALLWLLSSIFPNDDLGPLLGFIIYVLGAIIPYSIAKKFDWFGFGD